MHRLGFSKSEISVLIQVLKNNPNINVKSIFTHFSSADLSEDDGFTKQQAVLFDSIYHDIVKELGITPIKHACNSPAMVRWPQYHYDMVRLGIGLHGFDPTGQLKLKTASTLKTLVSQIQTIEADGTVGYSRKGTVNRKSKIAILPLGYEDCYLRAFGNGKSFVMINDQLCPTIGNICMDMTMVDVTDADVNEGDDVTIFGISPTIEDLAKTADTIPYEILTNVSSRVKRVFISE
jgi:alanine racemase